MITQSLFRVSGAGSNPAWRIAAWLSRAAFGAAVLAAWTTVCGQTTRTQTISLHEGWNAVFLEVYPADSDPDVVFVSTTIDVAAAFYPHCSSAQFITDPAADVYKGAGWGVWYAPDRPDAFLKTLSAIYGQQAYLVHSRADSVWTVTGSAVAPEVQWEPNMYNLVGFSVQSPGAPTFAQFFAGSPAHSHNKIYRLTDGAWRRVLDPAAEAMRSGEAFWIYCDGPSTYQGPLRVQTTISGGLFLGSGSDTLTLRNDTDHPVTATIDHVPSGTNSVPLSIVIQGLPGKVAQVESVAAPKPDGPWTQPLPPLEARASVRVPLEMRSQDAQSSVQGSLLKISTDMGTEVWVPVVGVRKDLEDK